MKSERIDLFREAVKRERWNERYNEAMSYTNKMIAKSGLICSNQSQICADYADRKITWKRLKELYKIM